MKEDHYQNHIQGMLCRQCEDAVCLALNNQRGILSSKCSFLKGTVEVTYDAEIINSSQIETVLETAGYPVGKKRLQQYGVELLLFLIMLGLFWGIKSLKYIALPVIETGAPLWAIFLSGLLTGAHCISMCGGITLSLTQPAINSNTKSILKNILPYHAGRLLTSTILGAIFGTVGGVIAYSAKAKSMIFTLLGLAMIFLALRMWGIIPWLRELDVLIPSFCKFPNAVKSRISGKSLLIGLFTGIMPCGASYSMWLYAAATGSASRGAAVMALWCLGTMPLLLGLSLLGRAIPLKYGKWMTLANIMLILLFGGSMVLNGLQLLT